MAVAAVLFATTCDVGASGRATYPGADSSKDPTGRWSIEYREPTLGSPHRLFLKDIKSGRVSTLLEFNRHVECLWSPDGDALAITDYGDSNGSSVVVFRSRQPAKPIDVEQSLLAQIGRIPSLYENGHRYFEAFRWLATDKLEFRVHAHDAGPGEEYRGVFEFDLRTGKVRQAGKSTASNPRLQRPALRAAAEPLSR